MPSDPAPPLRPVEIQWYDALSVDPWTSEKEIIETEPPLVRTIGLLVHQDDLAFRVCVAAQGGDVACTMIIPRFADDIQPHTILLGGDFADFFSISRFITNPKERDLPGEMEVVDKALQHLRRRFPKARIVWKLGNHEERWDHLLWQKAPELFGLPSVTLAAITNCEKHRVEIVDHRRPIKLGKLTFLHGHELEQGAASPVNPARGVFLRTLDSYGIGPPAPHQRAHRSHRQPPAHHHVELRVPVRPLAAIQHHQQMEPRLRPRRGQARRHVHRAQQTHPPRRHPLRRI